MTPQYRGEEKEVGTTQLRTGIPVGRGVAGKRAQPSRSDLCTQTLKELVKTVLTPREGGWDFSEIPLLNATVVSKILRWQWYYDVDGRF